MEQWEYMGIAQDMRFEPLDNEALNKLGRLGWELVSVTNCGKDLLYYFKRIVDKSKTPDIYIISNDAISFDVPPNPNVLIGVYTFETAKKIISHIPNRVIACLDSNGKIMSCATSLNEIEKIFLNHIFP